MSARNDKRPAHYHAGRTYSISWSTPSGKTACFYGMHTRREQSVYDMLLVFSDGDNEVTVPQTDIIEAHEVSDGTTVAEPEEHDPARGGGLDSSRDSDQRTG